jgi:hypothetical protein
LLLKAGIYSFNEIHNFFQAPNMVSNSRFHRWRHAQSLVNAGKVVIHVMQGNRRFVVFNLGLKNGLNEDPQLKLRAIVGRRCAATTGS